jgi:hypothetical protein
MHPLLSSWEVSSPPLWYVSSNSCHISLNALVSARYLKCEPGGSLLNKWSITCLQQQQTPVRLTKTIHGFKWQPQASVQQRLLHTGSCWEEAEAGRRWLSGVCTHGSKPKGKYIKSGSSKGPLAGQPTGKLAQLGEPIGVNEQHSKVWPALVQYAQQNSLPTLDVATNYLVS